MFLLITSIGNYYRVTDLYYNMQKYQIGEVDIEVLHNNSSLLKKRWSIKDVESFIRVRGDIC